MVTQCPQCKARFKARDEWNGKETKCPKCKQAFIVVPLVPDAKAATAVSEVAQERRATPAAVVKERPKAPEPLRKPISKPAPVPAYERPKSIELSDTLYVYSAACALAIGIFALFLGQTSMRERDREYIVFGGILLAVGAALAIYSTVMRFVLYYKMWSAIQDGEARTSAGKAVGLLLVPVLNIFWAVYMFVGFATEYNRFADRHSIRGERFSKGMFVQYAILWIFLDISFVVLFVLPCYFGIGDRLFGEVYASLGNSGSFRSVVAVLKITNILCAGWLLAVYAILSTKICRAINAI